jgi:DNA-binding CsgD family transcriptional regulator
MPLSISVLLLVLPYKERKNIFWGMLSSILLLPYFYFPKLMPSVITLMASFYIIYFFVEEIKKELHVSSTFSIFLLVLIMITLKDNAKVLLYYIHSDFLREQFSIFLFSSSILSLLLIILGPGTKLKTSWLLKIGLIATNKIKPAYNDKTNGVSFSNLTRMEKKVLLLFGEGLQSKQIAEKLFVSPKTIYFHSNNLKLKLGFSTTHQLIKYSFENSGFLKEFDKSGNATRP